MRRMVLPLAAPALAGFLLPFPAILAASPTEIAAAKPTVLLSASETTVFAGEAFELAWKAENATSCTASGAWKGAKPLHGTEAVTPSAAGSLEFHLTCESKLGSAEQSVKVLVDKPALSIARTFLPNAVTTSTSEGAPYADCNFWTEPASDCSYLTNLGYGPTRVVRIYICLSGEVSLGDCSQEPKVSGPLSAQMLGDMEERLAAFAGSGNRFMVRFTYNFGPIGPGAMDAPLDLILKHIEQVAPILLRHRDLIFTLEAGFIGTWGEWHDSTNGNDTAAAQKAVLDKELSYFRGVFPILVRYPGDLIQFAGTTPNPALGLHDDYYDSDSDDGATWNPCAPSAGYCLSEVSAGQLEQFAKAVSTTALFAGEFGALDPSMQSCAELDKYSYTYHPQSISLFVYPPDIGTELVNEGCALSFFNKVGVRIELNRATIIGDPVAGGEMFVALTLTNAGYGRVLRARPAMLVFVSGGKTAAEIPISLSALDLRALQSSMPQAAVTFALHLRLPEDFAASGPTSIALLIPDPAPSLYAQPAYALPLNSLDSSGAPIFDPATGFNVLGSYTAR